MSCNHDTLVRGKGEESRLEANLFLNTSRNPSGFSLIPPVCPSGLNAETSIYLATDVGTQSPLRVTLSVIRRVAKQERGRTIQERTRRH